MIGKAVCIVGPSCAGKTTFCGFLAERTECKLHSASSIPRRRYEKSKGKVPLMEFVIQEFKTKGMSTFSEELLRDLEEGRDNDSSLVIIDGFRACEEIDLFMGNFDEVEVFGIYADSRTRYRRCMKRSRDPILAYELFVKKDFIEYSFGIARMLEKYAKEVFINEQALGTLERKALALIKRL